jgi:acyl-CoA dehydrogenase
MFTIPYSDSARSIALAARVREFVETEVVPYEQEHHFDGLNPDTLKTLRDKAKQMGMYGPQIPVRFGGLGLNLREVVPVFEAVGRSILGPLVLNCAAPDEGNMHTLGFAATPLQQERYLRPLAEGYVRSAFAMTEPAPGAGSDPTMIQTTARRDGTHWVIEGHKWFTSGADGAAFFLVMARTNPDVSAQKGCTIFVVDAGTKGLTIKRRIPLIGGEAPGGHCEVLLEGVRVPHSAILGKEGQGFKIAQQRLGPARLTHCMRWTGVAERALEIAAERIKTREAFGSRLADKQALQWMVSDSVMELHAGKLMVRHAADLIVGGDEARTESSLTKIHVAESINRVIDRAIQMCGALGLTEELPLGQFYTEARAFRIYDGASEVHRMVVAREYLKG